jgi:uncharacterized membrane protein
MSNLEKKVDDVVQEVAHTLHVHPKFIYEDERTTGQVAADAISSFVGSWEFILGFITVTIGWFITGTIFGFDSYPFQAYTMAVSVLAILMTALVLLSQSRQAERDRKQAENAYHQIDEVYNNLLEAIQSIRDIDTKQDEQITILREQDKIMLDQHGVMLEKLKHEKMQQM